MGRERGRVRGKGKQGVTGGTRGNARCKVSVAADGGRGTAGSLISIVLESNWARREMEREEYYRMPRGQERWPGWTAAPSLKLTHDNGAILVLSVTRATIISTCVPQLR